MHSTNEVTRAMKAVEFGIKNKKCAATDVQILRDYLRSERQKTGPIITCDDERERSYLDSLISQATKLESA